MALIDSLIDEVASRAHAEGDSDNAENHARLLNSIYRLQLAVEKPIETAKRIMYQVSRVRSDRMRGNQPLLIHGPPAPNEHCPPARC